MSPGLKTKNNWQPTATLAHLKLRARVLSRIREFFAARGVLEVETPLLCAHTVTNVHINSFAVPISSQQHYYLQTSPEYAMKRLLAADCGSIYQISKAFRQEEVGRLHNPEFTLLEWYRLGFDHQQLMDEVDALLQIILQTAPAIQISYHALFQQYLGLDLVSCQLTDLHRTIGQFELMGTEAEIQALDWDTSLQLLISHQIEPQLGYSSPVFVYDFPATQAALAKIRPGLPTVAERFEVYIRGLEIANGFHELTDHQEQLARFHQDQQERQQRGFAIPVIDNHFIAALQQGLPECAGVALGIDRLLMVAAGARHIEEVVSFTWPRA